MGGSVHNLRSMIRALEERGELLRIEREVEPRYEMPAVMAALEQQRKAFIFERVKPQFCPVVAY